jgi:hypothetical protein
MNDDHDREPRRLTRLETLSAWLGLWKPRDAEVPPVPWRKIAVGLAALAAVLAVAAVVAVPAIRSGKEEGAAREERAAAEARERRRERLRTEQAAHHGRGRPSLDAAGRAALLERVRASVAADARRRLASGELDGAPVRRVECRPSPGSAARGRSAGRASYGCTAVTREFPAGPRNVPGALGHPFVVVVDFRSGRYTWCKTNPVPGERVVPDPREVVELPRECVL